MTREEKHLNTLQKIQKVVKDNVDSGELITVTYIVSDDTDDSTDDHFPFSLKVGDEYV